MGYVFKNFAFLNFVHWKKLKLLLYLQENDDADSRGVTLEEAVVDDSLEVVVDYSHESEYQRKQAWKQKQR